MPCYFLTWSTYGTWLHGDERGSVTVAQNQINTPRVSPDDELQCYRMRRMRGQPFVMSDEQRRIVDQTIREHCAIRQWTLHALNVRTNHVHVVCTAPPEQEKVLGEFKSWASRRLREADPNLEDIWTRHGSTRWINTKSSFVRAIQYVLEEQ